MIHIIITLLYDCHIKSEDTSQMMKNRSQPVDIIVFNHYCLISFSKSKLIGYFYDVEID